MMMVDSGNQDSSLRVMFRLALVGLLLLLGCDAPSDVVKTATSPDTVQPPLKNPAATEGVRGGKADVNSAKPASPHPDAVPNSHVAGDVDKPELVRFIVANSNALPGTVVDEMDATLIGKWQYSTHTPPYVGIGYLHDQKEGKGTKSVTFTPDLPNAGEYEVRVSHCYNIRRATNTPVLIHHADGDTVVRINQQETPEFEKLFRSVGKFRFEDGKQGWVRFSTDGTDGKYVIVDAVQFLPLLESSDDAETPVAANMQIATPNTLAHGEKLFKSYCASCHQKEGQGVEGRVPPLDDSPWVAGSEDRIARIVLNGLRGPIEIHGNTYNLEMPSFRVLFSDHDIASILTYVRQQYGKPSPPVTRETVSRVRQETKDRCRYWTVKELLLVQ